MAKRKSISKKIRFEVFKRDKFTCQYCGRSAPDVVLEVDHIRPVSKGGTNDIMNLVTSCMECNRGKSDKELSDDSVVKKQQQQIKELSERREQLEMMLKWRESLRNIEDDCVEKIVETFTAYTGCGVSDHGRMRVKKWLKKFSIEEILDAMDISITAYFDNDEESCEEAFQKIPGICYNRKNQNSDYRRYYCNYIIKAMYGKGWYCNEKVVRAFVYNAVESEEDFELAKRCLKEARHWTMFWNFVEQNFGYCR